jgi:hypothetical protein
MGSPTGDDERHRRTHELLSAMQDRLDAQAARLEAAERTVEGLRGAVELLAKLLVSQGTLNDGHERLVGKKLDRAAPPPAAPARAAVHLAVYQDKHQVENSDVDCLARLPICFGRCCTMEFELTTQDLDDGIKFEVDRPYAIRHDADRYCSHYDRGRGGCGTYETRPATCRTYSCKDDQRIWIDFEKRIPAPLKAGIVVPSAHR